MFGWLYPAGGLRVPGVQWFECAARVDGSHETAAADSDIKCIAQSGHCG